MPVADPAADLRAEIARHRIAIYHLAAIVGLHPSHLGQVLSGRRPLSPELAARIQNALCKEADSGRATNATAA